MTAKTKRYRLKIALVSGAVAWAAAVISCTTVSRTVVAPPEVAGATYVGSDDCAICHEAIATKFVGSTHAKLKVDGGNASEIGCESCHGPGSIHVQNGGGLFSMINPAETPDTCFRCPTRTRSSRAT
jgi:hypothetical protein